MRSETRNPLLKFAVVGAFLMFLVAGTLAAHVWKTREWLSLVKAQAAARSVTTTAPKMSRADSNACPNEKPVLIGFDERGRARCRAFSSASCPAGQYISSIDPKTLDLHCADAGGEMSCPTNSYITEFVWLGENHISFSCFPRLDPFRTWKFEPVLGSRGN